MYLARSQSLSNLTRSQSTGNLNTAGRFQNQIQNRNYQNVNRFNLNRGSQFRGQRGLRVSRGRGFNAQQSFRGSRGKCLSNSVSPHLLPLYVDWASCQVNSKDNAGASLTSSREFSVEVAAPSGEYQGWHSQGKNCCSEKPEKLK